MDEISPCHKAYRRASGYIVGADSGTLTKSVRRKPYSVVLLDEIEEERIRIFNILLRCSTKAT